MASKKTIEPITEGNKNLEAFRQALADVNAKFQSDNKNKDIYVSLLPEAEADVELFSSGSAVLDSIAGGGIPKGRIIEIYGPEASGKTSIALTAIGNVQRAGGNCAFVDAEQALDTKYARKLGVDLNSLGFSQVSVAEDVFNVLYRLIKSGTVDLIAVDSVAALMTRQEFSDEIDKSQMAALARVMSKGLRKLSPLCSEHNCTVIFLNQIREKVGIVFGNPETTPGGKALKFFASQRIEIRRKGQIKEGSNVVGTEVKIKIIKNKIAPPFGEGLTVLTFNQGINRMAEIVVVGEETGVLTKRGNTYFYNPSTPIKLKEESLIEKSGEIKLGGTTKKAIETVTSEVALREAIMNDIAEVLKARIEGTTSAESTEEDLSDELEQDIELDEGDLFDEE